MKKLANIKELEKFFSVKALSNAYVKNSGLQAILGNFRFGVAICVAGLPDIPKSYYVECERISDNTLFPFKPNRLLFGDEEIITKTFVDFAKSNLTR